MTNLDITLKNMISFSDFNKGQAGKIFNEVKTTGTKVVVKNNKPECVLISVDDYLKMVEEYNDIKLSLIAFERLRNFDCNIKNTYSQEEVEKMFCIDTEGFEEAEIE